MWLGLVPLFNKCKWAFKYFPEKVATDNQYAGAMSLVGDTNYLPHGWQ